MTPLPSIIQAHPIIMVLAIIWTLPWKGVALWKAANKKSIWWFIALLIFNTLGVLEILYIFIFSKLGHHHKNDRHQDKT